MALLAVASSLYATVGEAKLLHCWADAGEWGGAVSIVGGTIEDFLYCKDLKGRVFKVETHGYTAGVATSFKGDAKNRHDEVMINHAVQVAKGWSAWYFCSISNPKKFNSTGGKLVFVGAEAGFKEGVSTGLGLGIKPISVCFQVGAGRHTYGAFLLGQKVSFQRIYPFSWPKDPIVNPDPVINPE